MSDLHVSNVKRWLLKSPPVEWAIWTAREILIGTLRQGPIPQHVAFEMDGNRRYAQNHQIETIQGHHLGFEALSRVLEICYKSGVKVVTVYAFSIENFNRPKSEVKGLMAMAKVKLEQLVQHGELLDRYGARVKICGERNLIPADVLPFVDKAVEMTKHNKDAVLNICFPYTARAEITSAVKATIDEFTSPSPLPQSSAPFSQSRIEQKIRDNQAKSSTAAPQRDASPEPAKSDVDDSGRSSTAIDPDSPTLRASGRASLQNPENITAETINSHTYTAEDPPLDIFIRTSGVRRLSDFMLWQCHENTHIFFLQCFWPDFDLWHFVPVLLEWQWRQKKTMEKEGARRRVKDRAE